MIWVLTLHHKEVLIQYREQVSSELNIAPQSWFVVMFMPIVLRRTVVTPFHEMEKIG
jgi:hypothetical protein